MVDERKYASLEKIQKELEQLDLPKLLKQLVEYATFKIYDNDEGTAEDIVNDTFEKLFTQERKWYNGDNLESTIFGSVGSLCNNHNKKLQKKNVAVDAAVEIEKVNDKTQMSVSANIEYEDLRDLAFKMLNEHVPPPDYLEELIFECWISGLIKQQEIADYLEQDIKEIRKGTKRLKRKLGPIQERFRKMNYGQ